MLKKVTPDHVDILGRPIHLGTKVAVGTGNSLVICSIIKLSPKMVRAMPIKGYHREGYLVYGSQCVVVEGEDVLAYILKG